MSPSSAENHGSPLTTVVLSTLTQALLSAPQNGLPSLLAQAQNLKYVSREDILISTPGAGSETQPLTQIFYQGRAIAGFCHQFSEQQIADILTPL